MRFNKSQTFLLTTGIILVLVVMGKCVFLMRSNFTKGVVVQIVTSKTESKSPATEIYPVVQFNANGKTVTFFAEENLNCQVGDKVTVVYLHSKVTKAFIFSFGGFWLNGFLYALVPFIVLSAAILAFMDTTDLLVISIKKGFSIKKIKNRTVKGN